MPKQTTLEEEHCLLRKSLHLNLEKKHVMEMTISNQWRELKRIEIELEKIHETSITQNVLSHVLAAEGPAETSRDGRCIIPQ